MEKYLSIKEAKYLNNYKIKLKFNDGKENIVDLSNFILNSNHPDIQKYKNEELLKNFNLEHGEIQWNDYELVFPIYDLYQGKIDY